LRDGLLADEGVFLLGEDIGHFGGAFGVTKGLVEEFGEARVMDTPIAEEGFVGAALGFQMLFGLDLRLATVLTAIAAFLILGFERKGMRHFEAVIGALVLLIAAAFAIQLFEANPSAGEAARGLIPGFSGTESIVLAAGMLGATVMPHAIYLHSDLTKRRMGAIADKQGLMRIQKFDI